MDQITTETPSTGPMSISFKDLSTDMDECCLSTIADLAENNPMMACQHCGHIIKRFEDESSFNRYARFCHSRKRDIKLSTYQNYYIIIFRKQ